LLGGRYRVSTRLGSGGMADVFRARDEVLDREVAVKVFRAEHVAHDDAHGVERQQLEVAALARLNHPNLIALYDGSISDGSGDGGHAYIVMELIEGPPLSERIAAGPLPEPSVREIGIQLADGLAYVHSQGMVHRDVKPENILLGVDRSDDDSTVRARLSDFGIVRLLGSERLTSVNFTLGTASYLAPEQARGSDVAPPADIYSLALVLLEALTGQRAFTGAPLEAAMARLSQRPAIPADLPEPWPQLLHAMTEFDPALRPSAQEVARVLRNEGSRSLPLVPLAVPVAAGFADAPTGMVPAPVPEAVGAPDSSAPPARRYRPSAMLVAAVASVLVIGATLGIFLLTGNDSKSPATTPATDRSTSAVAKQSRSDHSEGVSSGANQPGRGPSSSTSQSKSASSSASSSSSAPSTQSSAPQTSAAPSTSAPRTSAPATSSPAAPSTPATSAAVTSTGSTGGSSPAGASTGTTAGSTSQSPNTQTTTSPAG
jgi:serine/threonine protein kinase